jgi:hypothetical protein
MSAKAVNNYQPFASTRKTIPETFPVVTVRQISAEQVKLTSLLGSSRAIVGELSRKGQDQQKFIDSQRAMIRQGICGDNSVLQGSIWYLLVCPDIVV